MENAANTHLTLKAETKNGLSKNELDFDDEEMKKMME